MRGDVSIREMSEITMIRGQDIIDTLTVSRRFLAQAAECIQIVTTSTREQFSTGCTEQLGHDHEYEAS
jgi:hypothetical protein